MKMKCVDQDGLPFLHIVKECLSTFLHINIAPKGSAFLTVFDNVITRIVESGLTIFGTTISLTV
jgi:phosphatidate phosphatase APP1